MRNPFFYIVLIVLSVLDAWLLAHPNLIGRAGILFFNYTAIATFPKALGTVALVIGLTLLLIWGVSRLKRPMAIGSTAALLAGSVFYLFQSFNEYNTGIYRLTGAGFRAGAILLPGLVVLAAGKGLWDLVQHRRS